ncbi:MAG: hypothetical protein E6Q99_07275 [Elusimicrobia bacterium]|jgi:hypothetical protein|nr:MAG: hypothetical protein E6Q99_07275 [Elusimicrobiota bacterium]
MSRPRGVWRGWLIAGLAAAGPVSGSAFDEVAVGARPASMGGAFTALADDMHALYYNPAGLGDLIRPEIGVYYARLFPSLTDQTRTAQTFLSGASPIPLNGRWGGVGFGYQEFRADDLFKERTFALAYGHRPKDTRWDRFAFGGGLKFFNRDYGVGNAVTPDPVFADGRSASAVGFDLGALYSLFPGLKTGLAVQNLNRPDLGLASDDRLPLVTRWGVAYDKNELRVTADLTRGSYLTGRNDHRFLLGAERRWLLRRYGSVAVRGGAGFGNRDYRHFNLGLGYEVNGVGLDYVFTLPLGASDDTGNLHNVALAYRFGRAPGEDELESLIAEEKEATARAEEALRLAEAEAAYVREERNNLLNQYTQEIERLKEALQNAKTATGRTPVAAPPAPRVLTAEERERLARGKVLKEFNAAYQAAYRAYGVQVERGASLSKRLELLNTLLRKFEGKGIDLSAARTEHERVKSNLAQVSSDFRITLDFYKKTVAQGADATERISLLERMLKKYQKSGIDLSEVRDELNRLKQP